MAIQSVGYVAPPDEVRRVKQKHKGGGEIGAAVGGVVGGVAGGIAGFAGGGPPGAVAGAMGGAAGGMGVGSKVGNWIDPERGEKTAIERRMGTTGMQQMGSDHTETLKQSIMALQSQPDHIKAEYTKPLVEAYVTSMSQQPQTA